MATMAQPYHCVLAIWPPINGSGRRNSRTSSGDSFAANNKRKEIKWTEESALVTGANKGIGFEISRQNWTSTGFPSSSPPRDEKKVADALPDPGEGLDVTVLSLMPPPVQRRVAAKWGGREVTGSRCAGEQRLG